MECVVRCATKLYDYLRERDCGLPGHLSHGEDSASGNHCDTSTFDKMLPDPNYPISIILESSTHVHYQTDQSSHNTMAPMLPIELILQIISYAVETKDTPTLSALSRTSRWLCTTTRPLLYESVKLHPVSKPDASGCFCRTIMENPELGLSVRDLEVDWFFDDWKKRNYQGILKAHLTPQDEKMGRLFEAKTERFRSLEGYVVLRFFVLSLIL